MLMRRLVAPQTVTDGSLSRTGTIVRLPAPIRSWPCGQSHVQSGYRVSRFLRITVRRPAPFVSGDQNGPVNPTPRKTVWARSAVRPRKPGSSRSPYHALASDQTAASGSTAPTAWPRRRHHCSIASSDRKKRIVAQVSIKSSYHRLNGSGKWTSSPAPTTRSPAIAIVTRSPPVATVASIRASR